MKHFVYILESQKVKRFYIGCTTDLNGRLGEHNTGQTKSTKPFRPWKMVYSEEFLDKKEAFKRE